MSTDLSRTLHHLTARMDQAADRILRHAEGISYRRYLFLFAMSELNVATQRDLARWLQLTEPSVSRMVRSLVDDNWIETQTVPGGGNKRQLQLSPAGRQLLQRCARQLEGRFADVVANADVPYEEFHDAAKRILDSLSQPDAQHATDRASSRDNASNRRGASR
jgi:DNA-binding MarR family transcriptional regulator